MLKRVFGIITALMLCSCMVVTALADGVNLEDLDVPVTEPPSNIVMSVDFESFDPNTTVQHVTGGIIWAVVSIKNYAEEIGDVAFNANFESSSYDRVIAALSAEIDLGSDAFSLYADENGDVIWTSPYASMNKLGSVTSGLYDNMIHTLVTVDDNSGFDHPLSAALLDEANGELFRIAIILNKDVIYDDAQLKLVEKDPYSVFTSTIAVVSKEAGETAADAKFKDIKPRASDDVYAYEAGTPGTQKTMFTSFNANNWTYGEAYRSKLDNDGRLTAYSAFYKAEDQTAGDPSKHPANSSDPSVDGFAITSQSYDLSNGFELSFNSAVDDNSVVQNMGNALMKYIYAKVGDYTFSMTGYLLPQMFYRGEYQSNYTVVTGTGVNAGGASPYNISKYKYKSVNDRENQNRIMYVTGYWDGWAYKTSKTVNLNTAGTSTYTFYYETQSETAPASFSTDLSESTISKLNTVYSNSSLGLVKESTDIANNTYTIKLEGKTLTFKKTVKSKSGYSTKTTTVFEHRMTVTDEMLNGFKNATIAIGGEHSYLTNTYYKNPKLVIYSATPSTTDKAYTSVAVGSNKDGITYTATSSEDTKTVTKINTVLGDIVKDGVIRASDYTALKASLTSNGKYTLDAAQMMQADIDLNGRINTADTNSFWLTLAKTTKKSAYTK